jgi:hypothetical protein
MFKFGRQRSTINILSTLGEEKNKIGDQFDEEEEHEEVDKDDKVTVKMRDKKGMAIPGGGGKPRTRSNSVLESPSALVLRGRDGRGAPRWMLERSRSAYIKPR